MGNMKSDAVRRVLISGTGSGCGKTTITCAVMKAFTDLGKGTGAFKCGPDYIDTMFHSRITGNRSTNLDPFFFDEDRLKYLLAKNGTEREINLIEGVMGYYDGLGPTPEASTYSVARATKTPVILIVNAKGASLSVLAQINGFLGFCEDDMIAGVILNNCSGPLYTMLSEAIKERFKGRVKPCGYMPAMPECSLESRHLGLVTAAEVADLNEKLDMLSIQARKSLDLEGIYEIASSAGELTYELPPIKKYDDAIKIAVARDNAFCFYYEDSIDILKEMGAITVDFSPLSDKVLPEGIQALYIGGGYPELYAEQISENREMLDSVRNSITNGLPCIAECGGFMYLTEAIGEHKMTGFLPGKCFDTGKLTRFGYITLTADEDNMLCAKGESIKGHEFHHWDCEDTGSSFMAEKPNKRKWKCVAANENLYAGFPHFHFLANLKFAEHFYEKALAYKKHE